MRSIIFILFSVLTFSCVQETHVKTVTFKVDMTGIDDVQHVGIRGNFTPNSWNDTFPLDDEDQDGIYEGTFSDRTAINQIAFKFVNNGDGYELQDLDNRIISFEYRPETIVYEAVFNDPNGTQRVID